MLEKERMRDRKNAEQKYTGKEGCCTEWGEDRLGSVQDRVGQGRWRTKDEEQDAD